MSDQRDRTGAPGAPFDRRRAHVWARLASAEAEIILVRKGLGAIGVILAALTDRADRAGAELAAAHKLNRTDGEHDQEAENHG